MTKNSLTSSKISKEAGRALFLKNLKTK